ncbi:MAG: phosphotransferase, partial [Paramuribaculum sp.]|nr:phosphotransferase [Paramuribaculum sp.]
KEVIDFLEDQGEIQCFMDHCYGLVDPSVETYMRRGFSSLMVCFGCTGGRHRSVYGAEHMARHLSERFGVRVKLIHRERGITEIIPSR